MKKSVFTMATFLFALFWGLSMNVAAQSQTYTITVIQPKSTDTWVAGTSHLISWTDNLTKPVRIYVDKGSGFHQIGPDNVYGSTWTWNIPPDFVSATTTARIKIQSTVDEHINSGDNNTFIIARSSVDKEIQVQQPNDGVHTIQWAVNSKHLISWSKNFSGPVNVYLIDKSSPAKFNSDDSVTIVTQRWGNSFSWTIPKQVTVSGSTYDLAGSSYAIRICKTDDPDSVTAIGADFNIVAYPVGAEIVIKQPNDNTITWAKGTSHLISWTNTLPGPVNIDIKKGSGSYTLLYGNVYGSTKTWYISNSRDAGTYTMKISDVNYPDVVSPESAQFQIIEQPKIDVYPNPSTTSVTVQFNENSNEHYTLTLYNRYNMRVMSKPVNTSSTKQVRINTFDLPNGIYFLQFVSGKEVISKKIVVQH